MFNFSNVTLDGLVVHRIGNQARDESLQLSKTVLQPKDQIVRELLMKYFLSPFKEEVFYNFHHEYDLKLNEMYYCANHIFGGDDEGTDFLEQSVNMAKHLYNETNQPNIKSGELYVVLLRDCIIDDEIADAIGIFKSENKETYLKIFEQGEGFEIGYEDGININKLDKGCLIFNTEQESGYKVCVVDASNKNNEARYWRDDFLQVKRRDDDFYKTQNFMNMCKGFVNEVLAKDEEVEKPEQIKVLSKSVEYFNENDAFDPIEFEAEVMESPQTIERFRDYKENYFEEQETEAFEAFDISPAAVKRLEKKFKSVIKLDKNFTLYVHGGQDKIKKGYDPSVNRHFYQLFFDDEN